MILFFVLTKVFNLSILYANIGLSAYSLIKLIKIADTSTHDKQGDTAKVMSGIEFVVTLISDILFINYIKTPISTIVILVIFIIIGGCMRVANDRKQ